MNEDQIYACIQSLGIEAIQRYRGCRRIDELPSNMKNGEFIVLHSSPQGGQNIGHWTALFFGSIHAGDTSLNYFDSFGLWPQSLRFIEMCLEKAPFIMYNNICLQSIFGDSCPYHVLYTVYHWLNGLSLLAILSQKYDINTLSSCKNDQIVELFFLNNFSHH